MDGPAVRRVGLTVTVALLVAIACGKSSGPTGPDTVPEAERGEHLQAGKNRADDPPRLTSMTVSEILALPAFPRAYSRSQLEEISTLDARGVRVTGFVARIRQMDDGDYHIQITEAPPGRCLNRDTPDQVITELTPGIRARKPAYGLAALRGLCGADTQVRLSGWLLFDSPHRDDSGRGTAWEVHPVTRIEICCWRELS
jgi:hypothetical protein